MAAGNAVAAGDVESRITRKLRRRLIPLLFLLYVVAYLDRVNIGFAALTMNAALAITGAQFGLLIGTFFWGYFLFEIPSNLLLHKLGARIWIARILRGIRHRFNQFRRKFGRVCRPVGHRSIFGRKQGDLWRPGCGRRFIVRVSRPGYFAAKGSSQ